MTSATCSITQRAAITALKGDPIHPKKMCKSFKIRRDLIINELSKIKQIKINKPDGAFYVFPDVSNFFGSYYNNNKIKNSEDLSMFLLTDSGVATVSGKAFGNDNCIRISYAASENEITEACKLIKNSLESLV